MRARLAIEDEEPAAAGFRLLGGAILAAATLAAGITTLGIAWAELSAAASGGGLPFAFGLAWAIAGLAGTAALGAFAGVHPRGAFVAATSLYVAIRVALLLALDAPRISDWQSYHELALGWLQGAPAIADQPMGYPILLGEAYRVAGISTLASEALNLIMSVVTALTLATLVRSVSNTRMAVVALALLALTPTQVLFTAVAGTETAYAAILTGIALAATVLLGRVRAGRPVVAAAVLVGIALGLSTHVRATGLALAPFLALLPILVQPDRRGVKVGLVLLLGCAIGLGPATALNARHLERLSPSTSTYVGWQLYVGANLASGGRFTRRDVEQIDAQVPGYRTGSVPNAYASGDFDPTLLHGAAQRDAAALRLAARRIRAYNLALVPLAVDKFAYGWGSADDAARWTLDIGRPVRGTPEFRAAVFASQVWWLVLLALAAAALMTRAGRLQLVATALIIPIAVSLVVLEVQPRFHEYVVPVLAGLAALTMARTSGTAVAAPDARRTSPQAHG